MTTETLTLTDFLLARIAEDEAAARPGHEVVAPNGGPIWPVDNGRDLWHLAIDPARVLAECDAKRRIVARHYRDRRDECVGCGWTGPLDDARTGPGEECPEMQDLALPYADHPDYRDEWKP